MKTLRIIFIHKKTKNLVAFLDNSFNQSFEISLDVCDDFLRKLGNDYVVKSFNFDENGTQKDSEKNAK